MDLKSQKQDTTKLDPIYAQIVKFLADKNYASASSSLTNLTSQVNQATVKLVTTSQPAGTPANIPQSNTPPNSGFSVQNVNVDGVNYKVAIVAIDTASESDCRDNYPVYYHYKKARV